MVATCKNGAILDEIVYYIEDVTKQWALYEAHKDTRCVPYSQFLWRGPEVPLDTSDYDTTSSSDRASDSGSDVEYDDESD